MNSMTQCQPLTLGQTLCKVNIYFCKKRIKIIKTHISAPLFNISDSFSAKKT